MQTWLLSRGCVGLWGDLSFTGTSNEWFGEWLTESLVSVCDDADDVDADGGSSSDASSSSETEMKGLVSIARAILAALRKSTAKCFFVNKQVWFQIADVYSMIVGNQASKLSTLDSTSGPQGFPLNKLVDIYLNSLL